MSSWDHITNMGGQLVAYLCRATFREQQAQEPSAITPEYEPQHKAPLLQSLEQQDTLDEERLSASPAVQDSLVTSSTQRADPLMPQDVTSDNVNFKLQAELLYKEAAKTMTKTEILIHQCLHVQTNNSQMQAQHTELQELYSNLQAEKNSLQIDFNTLEGLFNTLQADSGQLQLLYGSLQEQHNTLLCGNEQLQTEVARLREDKKRMIDEHAEFKAKTEEDAKHNALAWESKQEQLTAQQGLAAQLQQALTDLAAAQKQSDAALVDVKAVKEVHARQALEWVGREKGYEQQLQQLNSALYDIKWKLDAATARLYSQQNDSEMYFGMHREQVDVILRLRYDLSMKDQQLLSQQADMTKEKQGLQALLSDSQQALASLKKKHEQVKSSATICNVQTTARRTTETAGSPSGTSSVVGVLSSGSSSDEHCPAHIRPAPRAAAQPSSCGMLKLPARTPDHYQCRVTAGFRASQRAKGESQFFDSGKQV